MAQKYSFLGLLLMSINLWGAQTPNVKVTCDEFVRVTLAVEQDVEGLDLYDPITKKKVSTIKKGTELELSVPAETFMPTPSKQISLKDISRVGLADILKDAYSVQTVKGSKRQVLHLVTFANKPSPDQRAGQQGLAELTKALQAGGLKAVRVDEFEKETLGSEVIPQISPGEKGTAGTGIKCCTGDSVDSMKKLEEASHGIARLVMDKYSQSSFADRLVQSAVANAADRARFVSYWQYQGVPLESSNVGIPPCVSTRQCYAYVKFGLINAGAVTSRIYGEMARGAGKKLECIGFKNIYKKPPFDVPDDQAAPRGSIIVYSRKGHPGHITVKLGPEDVNGYKFTSDFVEKDSVTKLGTNPPYKVEGIYIRTDELEKKYKWSELPTHCQ